jgi:nucleoside-diphosphate kinase
METTLLFIKPDGVQRRLVGRILERIETRGLQLVGMRMTTLSRDLAEEHYGEHRERPFFPGLIRYVTSGPVVLLAVRGRSAIAICRKLMGATFCPDADPGTIRGDFGVSRSYNLIHGSDGPESAERELARFFGEDSDLQDYALRDLDSLYDAEEELGR